MESNGESARNVLLNSAFVIKADFICDADGGPENRWASIIEFL